MTKLRRPVLAKTNFTFPGQNMEYHGKVRDLYRVDDLLILIATDRISAFDHILPRCIPFKGQVLNQLAAYFLRATANDVPNWLMDTPDPSVTVGKYCEPIRIEMVIRGYLTGHAWRTYKSGKRILCGVPLADGMRENEPFPQPIITPTTKAIEGHDEDISEEEILKEGLVSPADWDQLKRYTRDLFRRGTEMARERGLILVDTKYEFGKWRDQMMVMDEIHTPDSSRYFYLDGFEERLQQGEPQNQLSKEFVREWLMSHGFQGLEGQEMPIMPEFFIDQISERYIRLYEQITGLTFKPVSDDDPQDRIDHSLRRYLADHSTPST